MRERKALEIPDEARKRAIASIRQFFDRELDEDIGDLKGAMVLDYFLAELGPVVYNTAIADAKAFFDERAADLAALCTRDEFTYWAKESAKRDTRK